VLGARVRGIVIRSSRVVRVADCTIRPREGDETYRGAIDLDDPIGPLLVVNNFLARGSEGKLRIPSQSGWRRATSWCNLCGDPPRHPSGATP